MRRLLLVLGVAACGGGETFHDAADPIDAADVDGTAGCPQLWTVDDVQAGGTASITGGQLVMVQPSMDQGPALHVTQSGLTGDFDASFHVDAFTAGGSGAFLQAGLEDTEAGTTQFLTAAIGTVPLVGVSAADQPSGATDIDATALTAATLRFQRTGSAVTVTASTADATSTIAATMDASPLVIGLQIGSNNGTIASPTTVTVDDFTLTGAGATSDTFDCDSLL
jgi:hypothetical protein